MLHAELADQGVHVAHTAIGRRIGPGGDHEPDEIAEVLRRHHTDRDGFQTRMASTGGRRCGTLTHMRPTLFEFAGGSDAFLALAAAHHARCLADPELNHPFSLPDQDPHHVERLAAYWAEVLGGPPEYSRSCGEQTGVLQMHAGNGDMGDLGERFVACFDRALDDAGLPADPAFRDAMHAYMRWAVDDVLTYAAEDSVVAPGAAMPRWGWDGLQG